MRRSLAPFLNDEGRLVAEPIAVHPTRLTLRASERLAGRGRARLVTLRGRWEADEQNRLTFLIERGEGRHERITLQGGWKVGQTHELLYRHYQLEQLTRPRIQKTLTFRGHWDLEDAHRLTYVLDRTSGSAFRFRGAFQTRSIQAKTGAIRYQVGVEVAGRRRAQIVTLFGKWKLSRALGLEFEVPYGDGSTKPITFGATFALGPRQTVSAMLLTRAGEPLGMEVQFMRTFLAKQGEAFVRLRRSFEESAIEAGMRVEW